MVVAAEEEVAVARWRSRRRREGARRRGRGSRRSAGVRGRMCASMCLIIPTLQESLDNVPMFRIPGFA